VLTSSRAGSQFALDSGGGGAGCWSAESLDNVGDTITDRPPPPPPRPWDSGRDDEPLAAGRGDDARDAFDDDLSDRERSSPNRERSLLGRERSSRESERSPLDRVRSPLDRERSSRDRALSRSGWERSPSDRARSSPGRAQSSAAGGSSEGGS